MKTSLANRIATFAAATALIALHATGASAAPTKKGLEAFTNRAPASAAQLPKLAKAESGVTGTLNPGALSAPVLDLTLADGTTIQARLQRVAQDGKKGTQSWVGTFDDSPGSILVLSKAKGVVTGFANYKDQTIEIATCGGWQAPAVRRGWQARCRKGQRRQNPFGAAATHSRPRRRLLARAARRLRPAPSCRTCWSSTRRPPRARGGGDAREHDPERRCRPRTRPTEQLRQRHGEHGRPAAGRDDGVGQRHVRHR